MKKETEAAMKASELGAKAVHELYTVAEVERGLRELYTEFSDDLHPIIMKTFISSMMQASVERREVE